jgi:N-acetylglutamate synthase-like GNAT family acetyltransferase
MMPFTIDRYRGGRDREIADFVLPIQNDEAGIGLTLDDQPDLMDIVLAYATGGFWIAVSDDRVIGCIGLLGFGRKGVLNKLFVAASYRGRHGPAGALLRAVLDRAGELGFGSIVLDTPSAATRSHSFYAKFGFIPVELEQFPSGLFLPRPKQFAFRSSRDRPINIPT